MSIRLVLIVAFVAMAAAGCASENGTVPGSPQPSEQSLSAAPLTPAEPKGSTPTRGSDSPQVQAARADLAARLGTTVDRIAVVGVREVTWSDGSLGCPQPGMIYTQALRNGQLVVLSFEGQSYEYHSGPDRPLFLCPDPRPPTGP